MRKLTDELTKSFLVGMTRVDRTLAKLGKTFTREFPILGKMTATGVSEKNCKEWYKDDSFLFWKDVKICLRGISSQADIDARIRQYSMALDNSAEIMAALESHKYVKALAAIGVDVISRDSKPFITLDESLLDLGVCVDLLYMNRAGSVNLTIIDGKLIRVYISVDDTMLPNKMGN